MSPGSSVAQPSSFRAQGSAAGMSAASRLIFLLPFLALAGIHLQRWIRMLFVENDTTAPEGAAIYAFLTAFHTSRLYLPPLSPPWNAQVYGPVYYVMGTCVAALAHGDAYLTTAMCRGIVLACFLGTLLLVAFSGLKLLKSSFWAGVLLVMGLCCSWMQELAASVRPDPIALFLLVCGATLQILKREKMGAGFAAGVLCGLSPLVKQSFAPLSLVVLLLPLMERRVARTLAGFAGAFVTAAAVFVPLMVRREPFMANVQIVKNSVLDWQSVPQLLVTFLRQHEIVAIPLLFGFIGMAVAWRSKELRAFLVIAIAAWVLGLAALCNVGAEQNYLLPGYVFMLMFLPAGMSRVGALLRSPSLLMAGTGIVAVAICIHQRRVVLDPVPRNLAVAGVKDLRLLTDVSRLEMSSKSPELLDTFFYNNLVMTHHWEPAPLLDQIGREEFDLVVLEGEDWPGPHFVVQQYRGMPRWTGEEMRLLMANYRVLCEVKAESGTPLTGSYTVPVMAMVPEKRAPGVSAADLSRIFESSCKPTSRSPVIEARWQ